MTTIYSTDLVNYWIVRCFKLHRRRDYAYLLVKKTLSWRCTHVSNNLCNCNPLFPTCSGVLVFLWMAYILDILERVMNSLFHVEVCCPDCFTPLIFFYQLLNKNLLQRNSSYFYFKSSQLFCWLILICMTVKHWFELCN